MKYALGEKILISTIAIDGDNIITGLSITATVKTPDNVTAGPYIMTESEQFPGLYELAIPDSVVNLVGHYHLRFETQGFPILYDMIYVDFPDDANVVEFATGDGSKTEFDIPDNLYVRLLSNINSDIRVFADLAGTSPGLKRITVIDSSEDWITPAPTAESVSPTASYNPGITGVSSLMLNYNNETYYSFVSTDSTAYYKYASTFNELLTATLIEITGSITGGFPMPAQPLRMSQDNDLLYFSKYYAPQGGPCYFIVDKIDTTNATITSVVAENTIDNASQWNQSAIMTVHESGTTAYAYFGSNGTVDTNKVLWKATFPVPLTDSATIEFEQFITDANYYYVPLYIEGNYLYAFRFSDPNNPLQNQLIRINLVDKTVIILMDNTDKVPLQLTKVTNTYVIHYWRFTGASFEAYLYSTKDFENFNIYFIDTYIDMTLRSHSIISVPSIHKAYDVFMVNTDVSKYVVFTEAHGDIPPDEVKFDRTNKKFIFETAPKDGTKIFVYTKK